MPAQIVDFASDALLGRAANVSYILNSVDEAATIAVERRDADESVLVVAYRRATAEYAENAFRQAGLRAEALVGSALLSERVAVLGRLARGEIDVLVTTIPSGWRLPERCRTLLHVEFPPYTPGFAGKMAQAEALLPLGVDRHVPEMNRALATS